MVNVSDVLQLQRVKQRGGVLRLLFVFIGSIGED